MKKIIFLAPLILFANIKKIEYVGLIHISPITANSIIEIKPGDDFNLKSIDKSIKKLYDTGYFQTIKAVKKDNVLIFECVEKPVISTLNLQVSDELKKAIKERNLLPKRGEIYSTEKMDNLKEFIKAYYLAKGYFNTIVTIDKKFISPTSLKVDVSIKKGEKLTIKEINFYGAKKIAKSELLDQVENRPRDFWSIMPFMNSGELNLYKLPQDQSALQNFYLNLGFMDARVSMPVAKSNFDNNSAEIDYKIYEGKRYIIKKISIDYPKKLKVKLPKLQLKKDKFFNVSALREDLKNIQHAFANIGYAYAKVTPQVEKKGDYAYITYRVFPGEIVYIRNVIITGNTKTLDRVVRRDVYLAPGDKYSYQDLVDSKNALQRSGYLENVKIEEKKVSANQMDLIVNVKEGLSGSLRAGVSYGSYTKLGFNFSVSEKNVFGSGQSLKASMDFSSVSTTYTISLFNPRILDTKYSFNASVFNSDYEGISYDEKKTGFTVGVGKKLTRFINANVTYGFTKTKLSDYNTTEYIIPDSTKSYVVGSLSYDNTDNYFFPTQGQKAAVSLEIAGLGGDEKYTKTVASFKYFYPIKNKTYKTVAVLKYRIKAGMITDNGYLPINEKFYLGGISTVRGFSSYSISPVDSEGNKIGGKYEFITGPEISTPISLKNKLWMSGFIDYGMVGENSLNITRSSYGIAFNWITPMGPLAFIWAWPIQKKTGDDLQKFEFSMGASF